jgi:hypothetical protein
MQADRSRTCYWYFTKELPLAILASRVRPTTRWYLPLLDRRPFTFIVQYIYPVIDKG